MKHNLKRPVSLLMALAISSSLLPSAAFADEITLDDVDVNINDTVEATADGHVYKVTNVDFDDKGNYVAHWSCYAAGHEGETVEDTKGKGSVKTQTNADCEKPATIIYSVVLDNEEWKSDPFETAPALGHKAAAEKKTVVEKYPNCTETGSYHEDVVCSVCGKTLETGALQTSPANGHKWTLTKQDADYKYYSCENCDQTKKEEIEKKCDHVAGTPVEEITKAATCEKAGEKTITTYCTKCDEIMTVETKTIPALGHDWDKKNPTKTKVLTKATCTKEGSAEETYACKNGCGKTLTETVVLPKEQHIESAKGEEVNTADCENDGEKYTVYKCVNCGTKMRETKHEASKALGHQTPAASVKENEVKATCTSEGSYEAVKYCARKGCGKELSREKVTIPMKAHDYEDSYVIVWSEDSLFGKHDVPYVTVYAICKDCDKIGDYVKELTVEDKTLVLNETVAPKFDCQPGSKTFTATYTFTNKDGKQTVKDTKTYKYYNSYNNSHTYGAAKIEDKVEPTCTENGTYNVVTRCTVCNEILSSIPHETGKIGHNAGKAVKENVVEATCAKAGSYDEVVKCTVCGEELSRETKTIAKLAHKAGEAVKEDVVNATCTKAGSYKLVTRCTECNAVIKSETKTIAKLAHKAGKAVKEDVVKATCTKAGSYKLVTRCTECDKVIKSETKTIAKLAHKAGKAVKEDVVEATYAKAGSYKLVTRCTECNKVIKTETKTIAKKTVNAPKNLKVKSTKKGQLTASWSKASDVTGYKVRYSRYKNFKTSHTRTVSASKLNKTVKNLSKGKKYYVTVRSYKKVDGKSYYSTWTSAKTVTIKK